MKHKILLLLAVVFGILAFVLTNQQLQAEKARTRGGGRICRDKSYPGYCPERGIEKW